MSEFTYIKHPTKNWGLAVRSKIETASESPLEEIEILAVDLHAELTALRAENERLKLENARLKQAEWQAAKDANDNDSWRTDSRGYHNY